MRTRTDEASFQGHTYRPSVLKAAQKAISIEQGVFRREEILEAAVDANQKGNQDAYLNRPEFDAGLKTLAARRKDKAGHAWMGSTVSTKTKLNPLLADAMLYYRIIQILDGDLEPAQHAPANRLRTTLIDARSDHRGLFSAIIPLEQGGDPNKAERYFIERKLPGKAGTLFGPFPMPEFGVGPGVNPVTGLDAYQVSKTKAGFTFECAEIPGNWKHDTDALKIDPDTRTVTIPFRVYRTHVRPLGSGSLSSVGRDFKLAPGLWKFEMTDAESGRVLKRAQLTMKE